MEVLRFCILAISNCCLNGVSLWLNGQSNSVFAPIRVHIVLNTVRVQA